MAEAILRVPDESSEPSAEGPSQKQQHLKQLHYRLMAVYAYEIKIACESSRLSDEGGPGKQESMQHSVVNLFRQKIRMSHKHRFVTKAFVESHIKAKLLELRAEYAQIEQSVPDVPASQSFLRWLQDAEESLGRFSATLTVMGFLRRVSAALWPLVIALIVVGAVWHAIFHFLGHGNARTIQIGADTLTVLAFGLMGLSFAALRKRRLFLAAVETPPQTWVTKSEDSPTEMAAHGNVYETEDDLFRCIDRSKRLEIPLDSNLFGFSCFSVAGGAAIFYYWLPTLYSKLGHSGRSIIASDHLLRLYLLYLVFTGIACGIMTIVAGYRRKPR